MELQQIIYSIFKTQIQFGVYGAGERLPTMEEACRLMGVSIRTIRMAYQRLQREGFVTIAKNIGARVKIYYTEEEIERNVQDFFSRRRDSMLDLGRSMRALVSTAQLESFKNVTSEQLDELEQIARRNDVLPPHKLVLQLQMIYGSLKNDLLMRLVWQILMFYPAPFLSVSENLRGLESEHSPLLPMIKLCRQKNWDALKIAIDDYQEMLYSGLCRFYENRIISPPPGQQEAFFWTGFNKASQLCYSLGMDILKDISWGTYPAGTMLPAMKKLAEERHVSLITVRRTLSLLGSIGLTKTHNGIGTEVMSMENLADNCDFTVPAVRRRLLDYAQSLQVLALSCRAVAEMTLAPLEADILEKFSDRLLFLRRSQRCELAAYGILELLTHLAPSQVLRTVYDALFHQLLWGFPIRNMRGSVAEMNRCDLPQLNALLEAIRQRDVAGFCEKLEAIMIFEVGYSAAQLVRLGITEAAALIISPGSAPEQHPL